MNRRKVAVAAALLLLCSPAWADVTATIVLSGGLTLDLDTGALGSGTSGDLLYTGFNGVLGPIGTGTGVVLLGSGSSSVFNGLTQADLAKLTYTTAPLPDPVLLPGTIFAAKTKTGKFSKILVSNNVFGNLVLTFNTFTANPLGPTIVSVQNNYGQIPAGLPNSALAPASLIFIKGTNLSTVNDGQTLRSSASPGLQNTISGVSVTVTVNGISLNCPLYYLSPTQIDAVLPGNTPVGKGTIFVTNNQDKSAAFSITVAQSAFGIVNYNGTLAATYDANNVLISRFNAANPGQTIVIWGSGVGGDAANDDRLFPQKTNNLVNVPMQVLVGGRVSTIVYRGRSQFPGVDQIVVTLPSNVPTGCYVSLQVITGNIVSNGVTIPVATAGKTCSDPDDPLTPALIQTLSAKATIRVGGLSVVKYSELGNAARNSVDVAGYFQTQTAFGLLVGRQSVSLGNCVTFAGGSFPPEKNTPLDAGLAINVTGPNGSLILNKRLLVDFASYRAADQILPESLVPATGGNFTFDNSSGGTDVQHFSTMLSLPSNFTWTNPAALATVDRQGATVTWSGGSTAAYVTISGGSVSDTGSAAIFSCRAPTSAGQFTIPSSVLLAIPPGQGNIDLQATSSQQSFSAPGLDIGYLTGHVGILQSARY